MGAAESGGTNLDTEDRNWILRCEGFRVEGPEGLIGHVVAALYEHSVRWDRPSAFAVRTRSGVLAVPVGAVEAIDAPGRRMTVSGTAGEFQPVP